MFEVSVIEIDPSTSFRLRCHGPIDDSSMFDSLKGEVFHRDALLSFASSKLNFIQKEMIVEDEILSVLFL